MFSKPTSNQYFELASFVFKTASVLLSAMIDLLIFFYLFDQHKTAGPKMVT